MCGRYQFDNEVNIAELEKIISQLNKDYYGTQKLSAMKTGEVFPTDLAPVIVDENGVEKPVLMNWGFPKWDSHGVIINARSETAEDKPMFQTAFHKHRCLIPATGFFEWQHKESPPHKAKYLIKSEDYPMLYMAGLYDFFKDLNGLLIPSFVILTTAANPSMSGIHDRMPLILSGGDRLSWLQDREASQALLRRPCDANLLLRLA